MQLRRKTAARKKDVPESVTTKPIGRPRKHSTNDEQSQRKNQTSRKRTAESFQKDTGSLVGETCPIVISDDVSVLETCTIPDLDLPEISTTCSTVEVPVFHKWLPEGRVCRRSSREELENLSDETFERRHRRHEKAEKAARNRERERFEHARWQQQVARDKLVHLTINRRLPVSPPITVQNPMIHDTPASVAEHQRSKRAAKRSIPPK